MAVEFVYFDIGGVILDFSKSLQTIAQKSRRNLAEVNDVFLKHDSEACRGDISMDDLWKIYQRDLCFTDDEVNFIDIWTKDFSPIKETHKLITSLIHQGYPVGILSNIGQGVFEKCLNIGAVPKADFKQVIKSCEVKCVKPEKDIYLCASSRSGVKDSNILFIDDNSSNLLPAKQLGWKTVLFDKNFPDISIKEILSNI